MPLPQPVLDGLGALLEDPPRSALAIPQSFRRAGQSTSAAPHLPGRRSRGGDQAASHASRAAPQLCDAVARKRRRHPGRANPGCPLSGHRRRRFRRRRDRRRRAEPSWFPSGPWPSSCAANSGPGCRRAVPTWFCPTPSGRSPGSYNARPGAKASRRCSIISPATSSASRSPTPASSASTTRLSPSATSIANPIAGGSPASPARSSCAASSSTSCRRVCARSATSASRIPPGAKTLPALVCCFFSTGRRRNLAAGSARTPLIHRPTRKRRTIHGSVPAAAKAF